jgi:Mg2+ and Co2+ transporter CorA
MGTDDESTGAYPHEPHKCTNERRLRALERKVDEHGDRLIEGTRIMDRLTLTVESLTKSVDILSSKIVEQSKPNPLMQKIIEAAVSSLVPVVIIMIVWAAVSSGAIPVKAPTPAPTGTAP